VKQCEDHDDGVTMVMFKCLAWKRRKRKKTQGKGET
jgi:hypothetical protein